MKVFGKGKIIGLTLTAGLALAMLGSDVMASSYGSWGSSGSYGSYGSSGSYGSYGSGGSYGSYGRVGPLRRVAARVRARRAARASYGSYGSYGSHGSHGGYVVYSSYGSYGSAGSYGSHGSVIYSEPVAVSTTAGDASIKVSVPDDAQVFVNNASTTSTGTERSFRSRGLRSGLSYSYNIRVKFERNGNMVEENKIVKLTAGDEISLSFGGENTGQLAAVAESVETELKLTVPQSARVFLAGVETKQTGVNRSYTTKRLAAGQLWDGYTIRVVYELDGQTLVREQKLKLEGGQSYELAFDFDSASTTQIAQLVD